MPAWTLKDLVAHLAGEAADFVEGGYFLGISDAWHDPDLAEARDAWTAGQVASRSEDSLDDVLAEWDDRSPQLEVRLAACGRPALLIRVPGERERQLGAGKAAATLTADSFELFRALSGRRSRAQLQSLGWEGDSQPYLNLLSPYELPGSSLIE